MHSYLGMTAMSLHVDGIGFADAMVLFVSSHSRPCTGDLHRYRVWYI